MGKIVYLIDRAPRNRGGRYRSIIFIYTYFIIVIIIIACCLMYFDDGITIEIKLVSDVI